MIVGGLGRHSFFLTFNQKRNFHALSWADWVQTIVTLALTKVSICLFLLRIVDGRPFKLALYGLIAFLSLFSAVSLFLFIGVCRPLKAYWNVNVEGAKCLSDEQVMHIVLAQGSKSLVFTLKPYQRVRADQHTLVLSIITDIICATFPIFFLRNLRVRLRTKVALCLLMGLGIM